MAIPFIDIPLQHKHIRDGYLEKVRELLDSGQFILGKPVRDFEEAFAEFLGVDYAVGVNSCTDALVIALRALNIGPGDEVICPAFTFIATVDAVIRVGATPVLVDIDARSYTISADKIQSAITEKTKAIIPVHLYGRACDMGRIMEIAKEKGLEIVEDCAQAAGSMVGEDFCGTLGRAGCFSFYPTKNLGGIGDGGMLVTRDESLAQEARLMRDHGRSPMGWSFERIGFNSRLDPIQAMYLDMKIEDLEEANIDRIENARLYEKLFEGSEVLTPEFFDDKTHTYCLYSIQTRDRDRLQNFLREKEIGSGVYYPRGLHREPVLDKMNLARGPLPVTDEVSRRVISLPCYPGMKRNNLEQVASVVLEFLERNESFERRRG